MKKILIVLLIATSSHFSFSQDSVKLFIAYKFPIPNSVLQCKMVPIDGGSFLMGSQAKEKGRNVDEGPQRTVTVAPFWMAAVEVTRDEFDVFYKDETTSENSKVDAVTRPSPQYIDFSLGMGKEGGYPVNSMSQFAALMYCRWLYNKTGVFYRLPTEAEWEYACRAGSSSRYYFGDDEKQLDQYAWSKSNSGGKFQKTGTKLPNKWGLYDMLGNLCEWTLDHYDEKRLEKMGDNVNNPVETPSKSRYPKAVKGGSYMDEPATVRSAARFKSDPLWNKRDPQIPKSKWWLTDAPAVGFRILCPLDQPSAEQANKFYEEYLGM